MKGAFVWRFCWLVLVFVTFGLSGSDARSTHGDDLYGPICLPPTDDHPSTDFAPKKDFYELGDTIFYRCRDYLSTISANNQRRCVAPFGEIVGFWTHPIPVCTRKYDAFSCNYFKSSFLLCNEFQNQIKSMKTK